MEGNWDQPFSPMSLSFKVLSLCFLVFSVSPQDLELESRVFFQLFCLLMSQTPERHSPPPFPPCPLPWGESWHVPQGPWGGGGLTCPSGGFHRETVAEDEKELKKQKKEEERKKSQEITGDPEEVV